MAEREGGGSTSIADWAQVASAVVGIVAALVAAIVGWLAWQQGERQSAQAKTTRTLEFFATFNSQDYLRTRDDLDNEDWCARYEYIQDDSYQSKVSEGAIISMIDFFDAVHRSCPPEGVQAAPASDATQQVAGLAGGGTCDRPFAEELLRPYARDLYPELSRTILNWRARRGDRFGEGMVAMADTEADVEQVARAYREAECSGQPASPASGATDPR